MSTIAINFPLEINDSSATIGYETLEITKLEDLKALFRFHIKNLLLTIPGERVWDSNFGVGLQRFLFEMTTDIALPDRIKGIIIEQMNLYADYINMTSLQVSIIPDQSALNVKMEYFVNLQAQLDSVQDVFNFTISEFETYDATGTALMAPP